MKLVKIIIVLILISCIFLFFPFELCFNKKEGFIEPDIITGEYDIEEIKKKAVIPLHIYQTWHTKDLPPKMRECVNRLKAANPEFEHHLYDNDDCREFIRTNFDSNILNAFDRLIPGAYKADLWRYCILYKNGGIYLDIKYEPVDGFKFISCVNKEYFSKEYEQYGWEYINNNPKFHTNAVYNGFMIVKPNNEKLFSTISQICEHVKNKFYGISPTHPTGPILFHTFFSDNEFDNMEFVYYEVDARIGHIKSLITNKIILKHYDKYRDEQNNTQKIEYRKLWSERKIYKE